MIQRGFTLIELLVVVAIIAILAAIAVPNFLEAQTRAKVAATGSDLRVLATGLEAYRIDNGAWPMGNQFNTDRSRPGVAGDQPVMERLTTPVAYISALRPSAFPSRFRSDIPDIITGVGQRIPLDEAARMREIGYKYLSGLPVEHTTGLALWETRDPKRRAIHYFAVWSPGPELNKLQVAGTGLLNPASTLEATLNNIYDPTNGTVSRGNLFRVSGNTPGTGRAGHGFMSALNR